MTDFNENTDYENNNYDNHYGRKKNNKGNKGFIVAILVCSLIGGIIGSAITSVLMENKYSENMNSASSQNITISSKDNVATAVAKKAMPSVVGITTSATAQSMFGAVESKGTGSGIIVSSDGYILTNAHVVKMNGAVVKNCKVQLDDGTTIEGKPVWVDSSIDVAIVKINTDKKLAVAELGNSNDLQIGEQVIAIGNPIDMAYQRTVTQGIISGLNRYVGQVDGGGYMTGLIQTDASINGGNSGGPLLNDRGQVIGINTVKVSTAEGLGFSIPINLVKPIIKSVIETGDYKVVSIGTETLDADKVQRYFNKDFGVKNGVFVYKVIKNSPAAKAGIENGDVIVKIGDTDISTVESLKATLFKYKVGDTAEFTIIRDRKPIKIKVTFTDYSINTEGKIEDQPINIPQNNMNIQNPQQGYPNQQLPGQYFNGNSEGEDFFSQFGF